MLTNQDPERPVRGGGRQPLYAAVSELLIKDIASGKYKPASTLPTEQEMTELYGVSRQTVRQALRVLRERGLISSHPGIGTIVRKAVTDTETFQAVNSTSDLLHFVDTTEMHATTRREIKVSTELAAVLGCRPGQLMSEAGFLRFSSGAELPMSYVLIYLHPMYSQAQETSAVSNTPIFQRVEQLYNIKINEIQQDITATLLDDATAELLQTASGEAALRITRSFYDINQTLVQVSISYYPGSRYTQSARFRATDRSF
ncbi:GntR family transcriptional regulator [Pseudomonas gingeri]|uniref:GntR family transcriptional regulator n=1 Tax=Pseudomonas gingeri TaxID=117681 RepID=A0A7Y8C5F4_9PSED|nr:GntR family transcriptional regulator [Pseudomonas gingeri]NWB99784.1 GntR family transcriptional regulator [Pseudomonas gingeri]